MKNFLTIAQTGFAIIAIIALVFTACNKKGDTSLEAIQQQTTTTEQTQTAADNELRIGSFVSGHAYSNSDEINYYNLKSTESGTIVLEIESDVAIYAEVWDNDEFIATNGDDFGTMNSRFEFPVQSNTIYRLEVRSYVRNTDGNFRITARQGADSSENAIAGNQSLAGRIWHFQSGEWLYFFNHYRELTTIFFYSDGNVHVTSEETSLSVSGKWQITDDSRLEIRPDNKGGELNIPAVLIFSFQINGNIIIFTDNNPNFGNSGDSATYYEIFLQG